MGRVERRGVCRRRKGLDDGKGIGEGKRDWRTERVERKGLCREKKRTGRWRE